MMMTKAKVEGWILEASTNQDAIEIWIKTETGETIPALFKFRPSFYAQPRTQNGKSLISIQEAIQILNDHEFVFKTEKCLKFVSVNDKTPSEVIRVWVNSPKVFKKVVDDVESTNNFNLFNIDIPLVQMFFYEMDLFPMGYCSFDLEKKFPSVSYISRNSWPIISQVTLKDSNENVFYKFPPLRVVEFTLGDFGNSDRSHILKPRYRRPLINEVLGSCRVRIVEGYKAEKVGQMFPIWMVSKEQAVFGKDTGSELIITVEEDTESETIYQLSKVIEQLDPDIILTVHGDEFFFPYLVSRASANGCQNDLYLSRDRTPLAKNRFHISGDTHYFSYGQIMHRSPDQFYLRGRCHIDTKTYGSLHFQDGNIHGTIEVARVSRVPLQRLIRTTIGGALQSIQFYYADKKGYLVPPEKKNSEDFQTTMTLIQADRGGHIFEPKVGVFERVCEFDFTSMYPMIMINYNISPEALNCDCCKEDGYQVPGLPFHTCKKKVGIIPIALKLPLKKRVAYKRLSKTAPKELGTIFKRMNDALKWILVVSFGYLGFRNSRFGRVEGHQSVCAYARELLLQTQEIAEKNNFRIIHGIVDSIWIQHNDFQVGIIPNNDDRGRPKIIGTLRYARGSNAEILQKEPEKELEKELADLREKANKVAREVKAKVNIPIGLDAIYKFIVFLPSRGHPEVPVLNHYWGVTYDGEIKVRGIELRRRDTPKIVKDAQQDMINILSQASGIHDFMDKLVLAKRKMEEYFAKIDSGNVKPEDLVITNHVSRKANEYKVKSYQAVASERFLAKGVEIEAGQKVDYIIKNASSSNPNKRIILESEFEQHNHTYDKEKYKELLRRAFQNIIPFDYDTIDNVKREENLKDKITGTNTENIEDCIPHTSPQIPRYGLDRFFI